MAREDIPLDLLDQTIRWGERKRGRKEREEEEGKRSFTFSVEFSTIRPPFVSEQEAKFVHATRALHRDQNQWVSPNSER